MSFFIIVGKPICKDILCGSMLNNVSRKIKEKREEFNSLSPCTDITLHTDFFHSRVMEIFTGQSSQSLAGDADIIFHLAAHFFISLV